MLYFIQKTIYVDAHYKELLWTKDFYKLTTFSSNAKNILQMQKFPSILGKSFDGCRTGIRLAT